MLIKTKNYIRNNTGILIRIDDVAENMNWDLMKKSELLFDKYKIKPLLGVIPNNEDGQLLIYPKRNDNYLHFFDVFQVIEDFGGLLTCDDLSKKLKKRKTTIHSNVLKLESFGLLKSEKKGLRKYWGLNFDLIRRKK